jgi:SAM-dependent methyltransferase
MNDTPPVCDYEGSDYRTRFWENQGRDYEDQVERIALRRLMPPTGTTLLDIGAGFGRLADEYAGYDRIVLLDYSRSLLCEAHERLGHDPRFVFVAANWYKMPFVDGLFQSMVQVRTLHHAADVPTLMGQLARIAQPGGRYVLEFANKKNLKSILRYGIRRQSWSPFDREPVEFVELNYDFHPKWIREQLLHAGFSPDDTLSVSHFRIPTVKKIVPTRLLVSTDKLIQPTGRWWQVTPSVFVVSDNPAQGSVAANDQFFACPECATPLGAVTLENLNCSGCGLEWAFQDGIYNFKEPV